MKKKLHPTHPLRSGQGTNALRAPGAKVPPAGTGRSTRSGPEKAVGEPGLQGSFIWWAVAAVAVLFLWSHWPTLTTLWHTWSENQDYSGGKVVPLIAAYLVWADRKALAKIPIRRCWWGLLVIALAQAMRFYGLLYAYGSFEQFSVFLTVAGVVLLLLGWGFAWRLRWVLLFLLLMFPLPRRIHNELALPLQEFATSSALFGLEMLGILVAREGNVLRLSDQTSIAVAEACSGLRMLTAFVVVAATLAFVVRRPAWQKTILVLSSIPVAILCNTLRLIVTALLYRATSSETAEAFFHDFAGVTMMPVAVAASVGLLALMKWLSAEAGTKTAH